MDENKQPPLWMLGGDARHFYAAGALQAAGLSVKTYGVEEMEDDAETLEQALWGARCLAVPVGALGVEGLQIGSERVETALLPWILGRGAVLVGGAIPEEAEQWLVEGGVSCCSVLEVETYQLRNAAVTAEAALGLAMETMERTLAGASVLIIGWGRIGRALAPRLKALGAEVTVAARREIPLAQIECQGYLPELTGKYHRGLRYDLVLNTVPHTVMTPRQAQALPKRCVCIELASSPGGFPAGRTVISGGGLPGKWFPQTAGQQLAEAVLDCLTGEGRAME